MPRLSSRNKYIVLLIVAAFIVVLITTLYIRHSSATNPAQYYAKRLEKLHSTVKNLPEPLEPSGDTEAELKSYDRKLHAGLELCREMSDKRQSLANREMTEDLQSSIDKTNKLCHDLTEVLKYSRSLYSSLGPYLTLDSSAWPPAESSAFSVRLNDIKKVTEHTIVSLEKTNSPLVEDPALGELISQVRIADTLAAQAERALKQNDTAKAQASADRLLKETVQDKSDFLAARRYFWQTTIRIDQLQDSVRNLKDQFQPQIR